MGKTLLLADDSITIQKVVNITFANEDFEIVSVDNGEDAVKRAAVVKPDIILADVVMPKLDGYQVCEKIKGDIALRHIPVLLLTGAFKAFDEAKSKQVGADGHIAKPFDSQVLIDKVKDLIQRTPKPAAATPPPMPAVAPAMPVTPMAPLPITPSAPIVPGISFAPAPVSPGAARPLPVVPPAPVMQPVSQPNLATPIAPAPTGDFMKGFEDSFDLPGKSPAPTLGDFDPFATPSEKNPWGTQPAVAPAAPPAAVPPQPKPSLPGQPPLSNDLDPGMMSHFDLPAMDAPGPMELSMFAGLPQNPAPQAPPPPQQQAPVSRPAPGPQIMDVASIPENIWEVPQSTPISPPPAQAAYAPPMQIPAVQTPTVPTPQNVWGNFSNPFNPPPAASSPVAPTPPTVVARPPQIQPIAPPVASMPFAAPAPLQPKVQNFVVPPMATTAPTPAPIPVMAAPPPAPPPPPPIEFDPLPSEMAFTPASFEDQVQSIIQPISETAPALQPPRQPIDLEDLPSSPPMQITSLAEEMQSTQSATLAMEPGNAGELAALRSMTREVIEKIAWEIIPDLAESIIREEIERLKKEKGVLK